MKKERINEIMNCECLQKIIDNDNEKHSKETESFFGLRTIKKSHERSNILFGCSTYYKVKVIDTEKHITLKDRNDEDFCDIPFLYCPICGTKTKHNITKESYYAQFQK